MASVSFNRKWLDRLLLVSNTHVNAPSSAALIMKPLLVEDAVIFPIKLHVKTSGVALSCVLYWTSSISFL
jgi:hypothetical protein